MNFFFDYVYYRITKVYFKWDGRKGITSIVAIAMVQVVLVMIFLALLSLVFFTTEEISSAPNSCKYALIIPYLFFSVMAFRKFGEKYNQYRKYRKDETKGVRFFKGLGVILTLILPWVLFILIAINRNELSKILYI
jgi:uncharacterized membrane protein